MREHILEARLSAARQDRPFLHVWTITKVGAIRSTRRYFAERFPHHIDRLDAIHDGLVAHLLDTDVVVDLDELVAELAPSGIWRFLEMHPAVLRKTKVNRDGLDLPEGGLTAFSVWQKLWLAVID